MRPRPVFHDLFRLDSEVRATESVLEPKRY